MANSDAPSPGDFVQSLARGLSVLRAFDGENSELTVADVSRRVEIPRAAARRFLHTLEGLGYARSAGSGRYSLTPRVLDLGFGYLSALTLPEVVQPHLDALSRQLGESASAAVLDGADIVYVARAAAQRIMSIRITVGTRFPAHATSMGRVLLASLTDEEARAVLAREDRMALTDRTLTDIDDVMATVHEARVAGWALVDSELEPGLCSIAVPIRVRGSVTAALNVSTSTARRSPDEMRDEVLPDILAIVGEIERELHRN